MKIQIKSIFGEILFEYEKKDNSIKDTLEKAIKDGASLVRANLDGANLVRANLDGASLDGASLDGANLYGAHLYGASLVGANLVRANLVRANLYGANLDGANLDGASLDGANLDGASLVGASLDGASLDGANLYGANLVRAKLPIYCKWSVTYSSDFLSINIGCKIKTIIEWDEWFESNEEFETKRGSDDFKRIQANYLAVKSYCYFMSGGDK